jgi:C-terminal processing protease CtpA/Prc
MISRFLKLTIVCVFILPSLIFAQAKSNALLEEVITLLEQKYVNPNNVDMMQWTQEFRDYFYVNCNRPCEYHDSERVISKFLKNANDYHLRLRSSQRSFEAIPVEIADSVSQSSFGFTTTQYQRSLLVTWVQSTSFAAKGGLRIGHKIVEVRGVNSDLDSMTNQIIEAENKGKAIEITVEDGLKKRSRVELIPIFGKLDPSLVDLGSGVSVLAVPSMKYKNTDSQVFKLVTEAKSRGANKLILDLRYHTGGSPSAALNIISIFMKKTGFLYRDQAGSKITYEVDKGKLLYTEEKNPANTVREDIPNWTDWNGKLVILVSERTNSIGETLASYLQVNYQTWVIGMPTAGGGGVLANSFPLRNGGSLQVSTHTVADMTGKRLPMRVAPDQIAALNLDMVLQGQDSQLEAAIKYLEKP